MTVNLDTGETLFATTHDEHQANVRPAARSGRRRTASDAPPPPRRAAVLGHPVAHSLSPTLHRAAYEALGLTGWRYDAVDVTEDELPAFVAGLDASWAGLSLTMPLKQTVIPLLDHVEPLAEVVGAVNTVLFAGRGTLVGANTDVYGIVAALRAGRPGRYRRGARCRRDGVVDAGRARAARAARRRSSTCAPIGARRWAHAGRAPDGRHARSTGRSTSPLREIGRADVVVSTLPPHAADALADAAGRPRDRRPARRRLRPAADRAVASPGRRRGSGRRRRADAAAPGRRAGAADDRAPRAARRDVRRRSRPNSPT